jgi:hypothetical protein
MAGKYWLDYRDGWLCVVAEYVGYDKPQLERTWYPAFECTSYDAMKVRGAPCEPCKMSGSGIYYATVPGGEMHVGLSEPIKLPDYEMRVTLKDCGKTMPIHMENVPIPCPKVRKGVQTKWQYPCWRKLTAKGWVSA